MNTVSERKHRNKYDFGTGIFQSQTWDKFKKDSKGKEVVLYGAGVACKQFLDEYKFQNCFKVILDADEKKVGKKISGIEVRDAKSIIEYDYNTTVFLITSVEHDNEIAEFLEGFGVKYIYSVYALVSKEKQTLIDRIFSRLFDKRYGFFSNYNLFYNYIIFHVLAVLRILHFKPAYMPYKELEQFHNIHKGERCFIVATGPSLKKEDLEILRTHNEIFFSMNSIMNIYDDVIWRPDYYIIEDPKFLDFFDWDEEEYSLDKICKKASFLTYMYRDKCSKYSKAFFYPISFLNHLNNDEAKDLKYSDSIIWGFYCAYTVTTIAMQIAHYMGFSEIYLLGTDCNYSMKQKHFSKERDDFIYNDDKARKVYDNLIRGYSFIGNNIMKRGTKIYNATRGGQLEVFERVDIDQLLS